ncbi:TPA: hypothetical protein G8V61_004094 [Salmonella enterica]|nr:hypothetical protein [Salmonella enterica]
MKDISGHCVATLSTVEYFPFLTFDKSCPGTTGSDINTPFFQCKLKFREYAKRIGVKINAAIFSHHMLLPRFIDYFTWCIVICLFLFLINFIQPSALINASAEALPSKCVPNNKSGKNRRTVLNFASSSLK